MSKPPSSERSRRASPSRAVARAAVVLASALVAAERPVAADVVRDGRIGSAGAGAVATEADGSGGLRHLIRESDGQRAGNNLFHSFSRFDLASNETAVYQGPAGIRNLVTTITGGRSTIDGRIRSEIAGANLYLVNPQGIVFGENATVDLTGALTVSTADRLIFSNGETLETSGAPPPILSVADPAGFGFLGAPEPISVEGSRIRLRLGRGLAFVGGDIDLRGGRTDGRSALVATQAGRLDLVSLASAGEVFLEPDAVRIVGSPRFGDLRIEDEIVVTTSGLDPNPLAGILDPHNLGSGAIFVRADDFLMRDAELRTVTVTATDGSDIDVALTGTLSIEGGTSDFQTGIFADTGYRTVRAPGQVQTRPTDEFFWNDQETGEVVTKIELEICGNEACAIRYISAGDAGDVRIRAREVNLASGGKITARSEFFGDAGTIDIDFEDAMSIVGRRGPDDVSVITTNANGEGNPGTIRIHSTNGSLTLDDYGALVIQNGSESPANGQPGRIGVDVASLEMSGNARIDSSTRGAGPGGILDISARDSIRLGGRTDDENFTGISTLSQPGSTGQAGSVRIVTRDLEMTDGAEIAAKPADATALGAAGNLRFEIGDRLVMRDATISTESPNAAGGNIELGVSGVADLLRSSITTSVTSGPESGGNITLRPGPSGLVLDHSRIVAQADAGAGGRIDLEAGVVIRDPSSVIDASSATGIDGIVLINGVEGNVVPEVAQLATPSADASRLVREPCAARRPGSSNRFVVDDRERLSVDADDYLAAPVSRLLAARAEEAGPRSSATEAASSTDGVLLAEESASPASSCLD